MDRRETFEILLLIGRPAAGKSEIIDFLKKTEPTRRKAEYHIGEFSEIDDFPMIWDWFEEDKILSDMGKPRLHTDTEGYFKYQYLWNVLIRRIELNYKKLRQENEEKGLTKTYIIEFSRGSEHGGYREAFKHFSRELLENSALLYIDVSFEESLRKNRRRFNPEKPYSILEHSLPDSKLKKLYGKVDWEELEKRDNYLLFGEVKVPFAVFPNNDDVTTKGGEALGNRLKLVLSGLWDIYKNTPSQ